MQQDSPLTEATPNSIQTSREHSPFEHSGRGTSRRSKITRKSHRKSRAGCVNCKSRRIKVRRSWVTRRYLRCLSHTGNKLQMPRYSTPTAIRALQKLKDKAQY
jgi:hypothetical protein